MDIFDHLPQIVQSAKNPVFFEVGTYDGYHTNLINDVIKKWHNSYMYYAFEPDLRHHGSFQEHNRNHLANIHFFFKAIGRQTGRLPFWVSGGKETRPGHTVQTFYGSSSIKRPKHVLTAWPDMKFEEKTVEVDTIEHVCEVNGIPKIDFIWADIQGAEEDMILGFGNMKRKIHYLYTEYCDGELYEGEITLKGIRELLGCEWDLVHDFGGDALFRNLNFTE